MFSVRGQIIVKCIVDPFHSSSQLLDVILEYREDITDQLAYVNDVIRTLCTLHSASKIKNCVPQ